MAENLIQHRSAASAWDRRDERDIERWLVAMASGACLVAGARHRSGAGLWLAMVGGALAWWAAADDSERRARRNALLRTGRRRDDEKIDETSADSFPASDAPAMTGPAGPVA
jgi:phage-related minor tail protein